jgi:hypothetical protein
MMKMDEIEIIEQQFLIQLFQETGGDATVQVSMYDVGDRLGLDRDTAAKVAQDLIGSMLIEIRTLSGGIAISAAGLKAAKELIGPVAANGDEVAKLGDSPILEASGSQAVEQIAAEVKKQAGNLGLDFDTLTELMADLKTIDAQMESSRPKTAIIRECLCSVLEVFKKVGNNKIASRIQSLVGR